MVKFCGWGGDLATPTHDFLSARGLQPSSVGTGRLYDGHKTLYVIFQKVTDHEWGAHTKSRSKTLPPFCTVCTMRVTLQKDLKFRRLL